MLKAQKVHLVTETDYHNKEERVKVIHYYYLNVLLGCFIYSLLAGGTRQRW